MIKDIDEVKRRIMNLSSKSIMLVKPVMDKKIRKKKKKDSSELVW
jgi:hypothetical protein